MIIGFDRFTRRGSEYVQITQFDDEFPLFDTLGEIEKMDDYLFMDDDNEEVIVVLADKQYRLKIGQVYGLAYFGEAVDAAKKIVQTQIEKTADYVDLMAP